MAKNQSGTAISSMDNALKKLPKTAPINKFQLKNLVTFVPYPTLQ